MIFFVAAACAVALAVSRRRVVAPLVVFGTLFLVARAVGFLFAYFASEEEAPPVVQVLTQYARIAPSVLLLIYACLVLSRRYRTARSNDLLRVWFRRAPYVHGGAVLANLVADLIVRPPLLEEVRSIPAASFYVSIPNYVTAVLYALFASYVFVGAAGTGEGSLAAAQRLQNLFWGIGLGGLGVLTSVALIRQGIRAFAPEERVAELVEHLSGYEMIFYVAYAGGVTLGIFSYYAQSRRDRFLERFLGFVDLVGDLAEEMANAPISKKKLNLPYATMGEAAGEELLGLSREDRRKMDAAFRLKVIWEHRVGDDGELGTETEAGAAAEAGAEAKAEAENGAGNRTGRIARRRMADLLEAYEYELKEPVLARGLSKEDRSEAELPEVLRDLSAGGSATGGNEAVGGLKGLGQALALVLRGDRESEETELEALPEWEQLAYAALADAGLLPQSTRAAIQEKEGLLSRRVIDAYRLARYKLHTTGKHREG